MASLTLRDSVWAEVMKSATKSFGPMGTPAMIRPGLYWMYATVPSVVTLSLAGGIYWTTLWADVRASSTGLPEGQVAMVLVG
jgi:hypothetical protein